MAVASGVIVLASRNGGYGNMVTIDHGNGYVTRYGHNNESDSGRRRTGREG